MKLNAPLSEILKQHAVVLGKTGSGKSSAIRLIVEHLLDAAAPVCIIDPKGDWWGLRLSANGKKSGYPIVIFGGDHADVPINAHSGAHIAELVGTGNRSCIIDLGGWMPGERTRFFIDFASSLFKHTRGKRYLVVDEVHNFAPQGRVLDPDSGKMVHWANRLASEGRGKGLTIISASQRPQKVHKDFLTCAETLIAMRVIHNLDRAALKEWIDGAGDTAKGKEVLNSLANMKRGEAWVWSPEIGYGPRKQAFPLFRTYDSFKACDAGTVKLDGWATVDLDEVRVKLESVVEQAKANDPKELRAEIGRLKAQLAAKAEAKADPEAIQRAVAAAVERERKSIEAEYGRREHQFRSAIATQQSHMVRAREALELNGFEIPEPLELSGRPMPQIVRYDKWGDERDKKPKPVATPNDGASIKRSGGEYRIMAVLKQHRRPMTDKRLGMLANLSPTSGTFDTYLSRLRKRGWIDGDRSSLRITADGDVGIGHVDPLPTGEEVIEWWRAKCGSGGMRRIFDALLSAYPSGLSREDVAKASDLAMSGSFDTYLSRLRTLGLIEGKGEVRIAAELFE